MKPTEIDSSSEAERLSKSISLHHPAENTHAGTANSSKDLQATVDHIRRYVGADSVVERNVHSYPQLNIPLIKTLIDRLADLEEALTGHESFFQVWRASSGAP